MMCTKNICSCKKTNTFNFSAPSQNIDNQTLIIFCSNSLLSCFLIFNFRLGIDITTNLSFSKYKRLAFRHKKRPYCHCIKVFFLLLISTLHHPLLAKLFKISIVLGKIHRHIAIIASVAFIANM